MATPFTTEIEVRFGDCDPAGIVYFPTLYHYCHIAFEDAWRGTLGISYPDLIARERIGFPMVHVETDFVSPARYGDTLAFDVTIGKIGRTSVVFSFEARVGDRMILRSSHTTVCLDMDSFETVEIPERHRAALAALVA